MTRRELFLKFGRDAAVVAAPLASVAPLSAETTIEKLHLIQLEMFGVAVKPLRKLLEEKGIGRILFAGTMTTQSGRAVAMLAPVRGPGVETYLAEGGFFAVLWIAGEVLETRLPPKLPPGVYALRFVPPVERVAKIEFVTPSGAAIRSVPAGLMLDGTDENLLEKIKRKLLELFGSLELLVDIKVVLGEPSDVRGSFLFFTFHLFDDP